MAATKEELITQIISLQQAVKSQREVARQADNDFNDDKANMKTLRHQYQQDYQGNLQDQEAQIQGLRQQINQTLYEHRKQVTELRQQIAEVDAKWQNGNKSAATESR